MLLAAPLPTLATRAAEPAAGRVVPDDVYRLPLLTDLALAPDGANAVYALATASRDDDAFSGALFRIPTTGGRPQRLTPEDVDASSPRFSPDGHTLAYLADRGDGTQIERLPWGGHRARAVTAIPEGVFAFAWSPDGRELVFVRRDPPPSGVEPNDETPIVITRSQIRAGGGFLDDRHDHLWIVSVDGGEPRQITHGPYDDSDPQWSPDGRWIAFVSNRQPDPDASDDTDLFLVRPDGGEVRQLTFGPGPEEAPAWSHRSDRLAFVTVPRANDYYQPTRLAVVPVTGGEPQVLTAELDAWIAADDLMDGGDVARPTWSADDATLYVPIERRGGNYLAAVPSAGGAAREVLGLGGVVDLVRLGADGKQLVLTWMDPTHPREVYRVGADGSGLTRLSGLTDGWLASRRLVAPEKVVSTDPDGERIDAWLYPPLDRDPAKRYPLVLYVHGGPQTYDGDLFDDGLENQLLPGAGLAVLRVNYRGSTSYGERFASAVRGDWHRREYDDLMAALDETLRTHPWLDPARLGIGGVSYGGLMTVWTVGHTDRFKVGVPERFEIDYLSAFGQDQWFTQYLTELGSPFEHEELYRRLSPGSYVQNIHTPLYLVAAQDDANCPLPQAMQLYQRLKLLGVPTELVIYPGEGHSLSAPSHLVDRLRRLLDWFGRALD